MIRGINALGRPSERVRFTSRASRPATARILPRMTIQHPIPVQYGQIVHFRHEEAEAGAPELGFTPGGDGKGCRRVLQQHGGREVHQLRQNPAGSGESGCALCDGIVIRGTALSKAHVDPRSEPPFPARMGAQMDLTRAALDLLALEGKGGSLVVDLGCGSGLSGAELGRQGIGGVLGSDLSQDMLLLATQVTKHVASHPSSPGVHNTRRISPLSGAPGGLRGPGLLQRPRPWPPLEGGGL